MSIANPLWEAPRIHGELLKLGIKIGQTTAAKYLARRRGPPSQGWETFLHNHTGGIAAMNLFVVPTISFRLLHGLLIMGHGRRQILWFGVPAFLSRPRVGAIFEIRTLIFRKSTTADRFAASHCLKI
jgi:hypothetical protein